MPKRKISLEKDKIYHIYNRWFNKNQLFFNKKDYERFFKTIDRYGLEFPWIQFLSYCILPNHFHFILRSQKSWEEISSFMRKIQQSYIMYLKTRYSSLDIVFQFEWRFKAKQITKNDYFNKCIYYVNYNAVKHKIVDKIEDYPYSSIHQLINPQVPGPKIHYKLENWIEEFFEDFWEFEF